MQVNFLVASKAKEEIEDTITTIVEVEALAVVEVVGTTDNLTKVVRTSTTTETIIITTITTGAIRSFQTISKIRKI